MKLVAGHLAEAKSCHCFAALTNLIIVNIITYSNMASKRKDPVPEVDSLLDFFVIFSVCLTLNASSVMLEL